MRDKGQEKVVAVKKSSASTAARGGVKTAEQFERVMGNLMDDLLSGRVQPQIANSVASVGEKMLRMASLRYRYGRRDLDGQLALASKTK